MKTPNIISKPLLALAALTVIAPVAAFGAVSVGDAIGTDENAIRAALEAEGYVVEAFEIEDDEVEVLVALDGQLMEIEVDPATGVILEIEDEDDSEDEEDDDKSGDPADAE